MSFRNELLKRTVKLGAKFNQLHQSDARKVMRYLALSFSCLLTHMRTSLGAFRNLFNVNFLFFYFM